MSFEKDLANGFIKTQRTHAIDQITNTIAGLFSDKNVHDKLDRRKSGPTVLQYPINLDDTNEHPHRLDFNIIQYSPVRTKTKTRASVSNKIAEDVKNTLGLDIATTKRAIISMYHPNSLQTEYSNQWNAEELGFVGLASLEAQGVASDFLTQLKKGIQDQGKSQMWKAIGAQIGGKGFEGGLAGIGQAVNPRLALMFQGISPRTFRFDFVFNPKSEVEVLHCLAIIKLFKYHSAPDFIDASTKAFFKYPDIFEIKAYNGNKENDALFKYGRCACTNIAIDYSPQQVWQTFENGFPVSVGLSLTFTELDLITKSSIVEGR